MVVLKSEAITANASRDLDSLAKRGTRVGIHVIIIYYVAPNSR